MTWLPLESKMFFSVAYDADKRTLYLRFRSADVYRYFHFPKMTTSSSYAPNPKAGTSSAIFGTAFHTNAWPSSKSLDQGDLTIRLLGNVR
jgi:hypothetical protein